MSNKDRPDPLLKALEILRNRTERANQERSEMDKEEALGRADAGAWFLEVLTRATNQILPIRVIGNTTFAATRAKCFNVNLKEYQQNLRERLTIANKKVATLRNQKP